jgi:septin family protein
MQDLQEVTHESHYETYRSEKLQLKKHLDHNEKQKKVIQEKDNEVKRSLISRFRYLLSIFPF